MEKTLAEAAKKLVEDLADQDMAKLKRTTVVKEEVLDALDSIRGRMCNGEFEKSDTSFLYSLINELIMENAHLVEEAQTVLRMYVIAEYRSKIANFRNY